jgi:arylsulfatase A-like enzyme
VITLVWDGGGRGVLDEWPDGWPNLRRLIGEGTWYERVTVGSSPSTSAPIHATIGTGTFPKRHGLIENAQVQLGLLGHGSTWGGGDRDIAVLKRVAGTRTRTGSGESHRRAGPPSPRPGT